MDRCVCRLPVCVCVCVSVKPDLIQVCGGVRPQSTFNPGFRDKQQMKPTLRDLQSKSGSSLTPAPIPSFSAEPVHGPQPCGGTTLLDMSPAHVETPPPPPEVTLTDVFVPLESIQPSK